MALPGITKAENVKIAEMAVGSGWIDRRMIGDETDVTTIRQVVEILTQNLYETEVRNSRGLLCVRPS